jgi:hypothetical protein
MVTLDPMHQEAYLSRLRPNTPMQLTPLRVPKIGAFLKVGIGSKLVPTYWWRRN